MTTTTQPAPALPLVAPLAWIGRSALLGVGYLGGLGNLLLAALHALVRLRARGTAASFVPAVSRQLGWMLGMGFPLVGLVHVGIGSFLSMQAYFGGTFVEGTGAVVGVGLIRNVAPLLAGMTLAGLFAARITAELRGGSRKGLDGDPGWVADRAVVQGRQADPRPAPAPGRVALVRITAALVAGPVLVFWAVLVGTVVGWQVAQTLLGVSTQVFFSMFLEMIWVRDVLGLIAKGTAFAFFAALFACHEGLRGPSAPGPDSDSVSVAACRAACLASAAILIVNSGWFLLLYHVGATFGPTLLAPPAP